MYLETQKFSLIISGDMKKQSNSTPTLAPSSIIIYPNPVVGDSLNFKIENSKIEQLKGRYRYEVLSMNGQRVAAGETANFQVSGLSQLPNGTYILRLHHLETDLNGTKRFVKLD
jgi:hypothetical protein